MENLVWVLIGAWPGFIVGYLFKGWTARKFKSSSGTIVVNRDKLTEKIVYSLVLDDYPEELRFKKVVIFNVINETDSSVESSDRK